MPSENDVNFYNDMLCDLQAVVSHNCKLGTICIAGDLIPQLFNDARCYPNRKSEILSTFIQENGLIWYA